MRPVHLSRQLSLNKTGLTRALHTHRANLGRMNEHLATGKKVNRASDDPTAFARIRRLDVLENRYGQYQRSIDAARVWTDHSQENLTTLADLFTDATEEGIQADNDTVTDDDREAIASSLESLFASVLDTLNTRVDDDEYLFAGTNVAEPPFVQDFGAGADATGVRYTGNSTERERAIGPEVNFAVNTAGDRLFDTGDGFTITEALQGLIDTIRTGDNDQIQASLDQVIEARDHLLSLSAEAGDRANRLDQVYTQLDQAGLHLAAQRSRLEDADLAETILAMEQADTGLQATLQTLATVQQSSLLDYLR